MKTKYYEVGIDDGENHVLLQFKASSTTDARAKADAYIAAAVRVDELIAGAKIVFVRFIGD